MNQKEDIQTKLNDFITMSKFSDEQWESQGLNPSSKVLSQKLELFLNDLAKNILNLIQTKKTADIKRMFSTKLKSLKANELDTEEREFVADYLAELSEITKCDINKVVMKWMYGDEIAEAIFLKRIPEDEEKITQECISCKIPLETYIKREDGTPSYSWFIIQCNKCKAHNILDAGPNIKSIRFGNYKHVRQMRKDEFTKEQVDQKIQELNTQ